MVQVFDNPHPSCSGGRFPFPAPFLTCDSWGIEARGTRSANDAGALEYGLSVHVHRDAPRVDAG